jgi:peptidyl-Lys metalloendopeptidase
VVALIAAVALASPHMAAADTAPVLRATVTSPTAEVSADAPVSIRVTLANPTARDVAVAAWDTPARGVRAPILRITRDGAPVAYTGMLAKRADAAGTDLISIPAGASRAWDVTADSSWDFSRDGIYEVRFDSPAVAGPSDAVRVRVAGRRAATSWQGTGRVQPFGVTYTGCTSGQQAQAEAGLAAADAYAAEAKAHLGANWAGARYTQWFGTYDLARWQAVATNFDRIHDVTSGQLIAFTCATIADCGGTGVFAYVYPNQPYAVYLCSAFWTTTTTGTDSRAGTIIHEVSHFTVVAGTDDWVYGQAAAATLASTNPARSVNNADNHEYFAENTPAIADAGAAYAASATAIDFGGVPAGASADRTVTLTSSGTVPLVVSALAVADPAFQIVADACTGQAIAPAGACDITVRFTAATGGASGTLTITANAPAPPAAIAVTGAVLQPVAAPAPPADPPPAAAPAAPAAAKPTQATARLPTLNARVRSVLPLARLTALAGLRAPRGSRVTIASTPSGLMRTRSGLRITRAGTYRVRVTVRSPGGRATTKDVQVVAR